MLDLAGERVDPPVMVMTPVEAVRPAWPAMAIREAKPKAPPPPLPKDQPGQASQRKSRPKGGQTPVKPMPTGPPSKRPQQDGGHGRRHAWCVNAGDVLQRC